MALLIDTPRWPWRGELWAHLISDESLDELHDTARTLGLRWVSFGRDHYDVPQRRWHQACEIAELVDSREIVRSLRRTGLRVPGGKPKKSWQPIAALPHELHTTEIDQWLAGVRSVMPQATVQALARPDQWLVMHLNPDDHRPDLGALTQGAAEFGAQVIETSSDGRYSLELVFER